MLPQTPSAKLRALDEQIWLGAHPDQNQTFDKIAPQGLRLRLFHSIVDRKGGRALESA